MKFVFPPYPHQMDALEKSKDTKHLALLWEMGTGKTYGLINILRSKYMRAGALRRTLILAPSVTLHNWKDEFLKYSKIPRDNVIVISGTGVKRIKSVYKAITNAEGVANRDKIIIINYEALLNDEIYDLLKDWKAEIVVADEIHYLKSAKAQRTKRATFLADAARNSGGHVFGLTGTVILNSVLDLFSQWRFLDGGFTFGTKQHAFKHTYMIPVTSTFGSSSFTKWKDNPKKFNTLHEVMQRNSTRVLKKDVLHDLPELVKQKKYIELGTEQKKAHTEMKRDFLTWVKGLDISKPAVATVAVTKALRLMQIVSGFVKTEDGEEHEFSKVPRLQMLEEDLQKITRDNKVIVWCCFKKNYEQIGKVCEKLGLHHVYITGKQTTDQKRESVKTFTQDPDCKVVIANRRAGGIGINLVEASYSIVYSRNFSLDEELQSEARNHRKGSEMHEKITKIDYVSKDTVDEACLKALMNKEKIGSRIVDMVKGE